MSYSILRDEEYDCLSRLSLDGKILDIGGSKKSGYHELIKGNHSFTVVNIDEKCEPDVNADVEKPFPFGEGTFDHSICLNVYEHVFEFEHVFSEQLRCIRQGGKIVIAAPFMHFIHASPDDYLRFTSSTYYRLAKKYGAKIEQIDPLGYGLFSLFFQLVGGRLPTRWLEKSFQRICVRFDQLLNRFSPKYRVLTKKIPLGYFVIFEK